MNKFLFLFFASIWFMLSACSEEGPVTPLPPPCNDFTVCDTCDTRAPRSLDDSLMGIYPAPAYRIHSIHRSPDGKKYYGSCTLDDWDNQSGVYVNFMYELASGEITTIPGKHGSEITSDGRKLVTLASSGHAFIVDLENYSYSVIPLVGGYPTWSLDNKRIFYSSGGGCMSRDTNNAGIQTYLTSDFSQPRQLNDSTLVGIRVYGFLHYDLHNGVKEKYAFDIPSGDLRFRLNDNWDLSPDRTKALIEVESTTYTRDENGWFAGGLFLFDFTTLETKKILPRQYWEWPYIARWSSNSTFFATYHCRKDSAAMVYEFDLNGNTLRQVTFKEQRFYP